MRRDDAVLYVHCWSGRGRAGLIGGALLALLRPELPPGEVLRITQAGYDSRTGAGLAPARGQRSPQTDEQVAWLEDFVLELRRRQQPAVIEQQHRASGDIGSAGEQRP